MRLLTTLLLFLAVHTSIAQDMGLQWVQPLTTNGSTIIISDMATDVSGNVLITGVFSGEADLDPSAAALTLTSAGSTDVFFAKYSNTGALIWGKHLGSIGIDGAASIRTDASSNVYIAGYFESTIDFDPNAGTQNLTSNGGQDMFVAKYTSAGNYLGAVNIGGTSSDWARGMDLLEAGAGAAGVYITGNFQGTVDFNPGAGTNSKTSVGSTDLFVVKFDISLNYLFAITMGGTGSESAGSIAATVNYFFVTGSFSGTADFDPTATASNLVSAGGNDIFIARYHYDAGLLQFVKRMGSTGDDYAPVCDSNGTTLTVGGSFNGTVDLDPGAGTTPVTSNGSDDIWFARYDASLNFTYGGGFGGTASDGLNSIRTNSILVMLAGTITGTVDADITSGVSNVSSNPLASSNGFFAYYNTSDGTLEWAKTAGSEGSDILYSSTDAIYAAGRFSSSSDLDPGAGTRSISTTGVDAFFGRYPDVALEPNTQATSLSFSTIGTTSFTYTVGFGSGGSGRLILIKQGSAVDAFPADGITYTASSTYGSGSQIGTGNYVITSPGASPVTISGLTSGQTYHVRAFEYSSGSTKINYHTATATGNPAIAVTEPTNAASNVSFALLNSTSYRVSWTNGDGQGRLVIARAVSSFSFSTVDGTTYTAGVNSNFSSASDIGSGHKVVYAGTGNFVDVSGLSASTIYNFKVVEYNGSGAQINYKTNNLTTNPAGRTTLAAAPTSQTSSLAFSLNAPNDVKLDFAPGNGSSRVIVAKLGSAVDVLPNDGQPYTAAAFGAGSDLGGGCFVVYNGTGNSTVVTGLQPNNTYHFRAFEYNGTADAENYYTVTATGNPGSSFTVAAEPTTQTTGISFSSVTPGSLTLNWTNGSGSERIIFARAAAEVLILPDDKTAYTPNSDFSAAPLILSGTKAVYAGSGTSVVVTGLDPETVYHFRAFEYNGSAVQTNYLTSSATGNPASRTTYALMPNTQAQSVSFSTIASNSVGLNFTNGNGTNRLIVAKQGFAVDANPVSGTTYTANSTFGAGTEIGTGNFVVWKGSGPASIAGLASNTTYFFRVYEFSGSSGAENYNTSSAAGNPASITTLFAEPTTQASGLSFSNLSTNTFTLSWINGNGSERLVLAKEGSPVISEPVDGSSYVGNADYTAAQDLSGSKIVYRGSGSSAALTGLSTATAYHFKVFELNGSGSQTNYQLSTVGGNPASQNTLANEPSVQATSLGFTSIGVNSVTLNFSNGNGTGRLIVARQGAAVNADPVDGTTYAINNTFGVGSQIGSGNYVVGSGTSPVTISNLLSSTTYHFRVYEFNGSLGTENYNVLSTGTNPANATTILGEPSTQASNLVFTSLGVTSLTVSWTSGNGSERIVFAKEGSAVSDDPADGVTYTPNTHFSAAAIVGSGNRVVYRGSGTSAAITGLSPGTAYHFRVFELNGSAAQSNYLIQAGTGNPSSKTTLTEEPTVGASGLSFTNIGSTSATLSFTNGNGSNRLVVVKAGGVDSSPIDANTYVGGPLGTGSQLGTQNYVVHVGAGPVNITGLTPNTSYAVRVFEFNGSNGSENYTNAVGALNPATLNTVVPEPLVQASALSFSSPAATSLNLSWTNGDGSKRIVIARQADAVSFSPLDGMDYAANSNFPSATDLGSGNKAVYSGDGNTVNVSGLNEGVVYHFAVFEYAGTGISSNYLTSFIGNTGSRSTLVSEPAAQPTALGFSNVKNSSLNVSFTGAAGAAGYVVLRKTGSAVSDVPVDGAAYSKGNDIGASIVAYVGTDITFAETNLIGSTNYFYAVFSFKGTGQSVNYLTASPLQSSKLTTPDPPVVVIEASSVQATSFKATWTGVAGATGYQMDVSKDDFQTTIENYNSKLLAESARDEVVSGLTVNVTYKVRLRAVNATGASPNSTDVSVITVAPVTLNIPNTSAAPIFVNVGSVPVSVQVSGATSATTVAVKHIALSSTGAASTTPATLKTGTTNVYEATIPLGADEIGVEYYFTAADGPQSVSQTVRSYVYLAAPLSLKLSPDMNGKASTYQMFSVPLQLTDRNAENVFEELGGYDKKKWRLFHYQGGENKEYKAGFNNIEPGLGYWINAKSVPADDIKLGEAKASEVTKQAPFTLQFEKGWNQIGNPYPFSLDWNAVKASNSSVGLNSLFEMTGGGYVKQTGLHVWKGAFVFADNGGVVTFPLTAKCSACRVNGEEFVPSLDKPIWQLPIQLTSNGWQQTSTIGMHPEASVSKDKFDDIAPPRFLDYLELTSEHKEFFAHHFASDVVPSSDAYEWIFESSSNFAAGKAVLEWDHDALAQNESSLLLVDMADNVMINMKSVGRYQFNYSDRRFKIMYSRYEEFDPDIVMLGAAYPNPFTVGVDIPLLVNNKEEWTVDIYNLLGQRIKTVKKEFNKTGLQSIAWDGRDENGVVIASGVYLYKVSNSSGDWSSNVKRLVKQ